jgi:phospholipase C
VVEDKTLPQQEPGQRPARPLPYSFDAKMDGTTITFRNDGAAGAGFIVYSARAGEGPWFYMVESGKTLSQTLPIDAEYDLSVHGSNGYFRRFQDGAPQIAVRYEAGTLILTVQSAGAPVILELRDAYRAAHSPVRMQAAPTAEHRTDIAATDHWYDLTVIDTARPNRPLRLAGHVETGNASRTDPAIGRA